MPAAAPLLLLLAILWWPLVLPLAPGHLQSPPTFITLNGSRLNHLLLDTHSGHVYVGAVNVLYHLSPDLQLLSWGKTGPKLDSPDCLPPIDPTDCTQAETTDNTNKLLLLEEVKEKPVSLIVCGTVLQGICEKRSLENVSQVLYKTDNPVDTQYVAANDPRVSTVGVVVEQKDVMLMLVGRGYTSKGPGGIPPITMRRLTPVARHSAPAFSHEELGKLVVGSYSEYNNHFVKAFPHNHYVYFVFSRRDVWGKREYRTYVSRLCAGDPNFYSYVEVPLSCGGGYNLAQAAVLGYHRDQPTLFVAMAMGQASTPTPTDRSALCVYKVEELDKALHGVMCAGHLLADSLIKYPCGGEHTPSPIASAIALEATPTFTWNPLITAVTTATEVGHTIVLLGDKNGRLHKVFLHANGTGTKYDTVEVDAEISNVRMVLRASDLCVFQVTKLHIAQCEKHLDCHSCLSNRDPYCGWCLLEGRCKRKMDCTRHAQPHHWIWSYSRERQCVSIESLQPSILSREEQTQVSFTVLQLPVLSKDESLSCAFGSLAAQPAVVMENRITCQSPAPEQLPPSPPGNGEPLQLYDCSVGQSDCSQCRAVAANYGCVWCADETPGCVYNQSCTSGTTDTCPAPVVTEVEPLTGPLEGGILLTIQGSNLGQSFQDIQAGVTVAGVTCTPLPEAYRISTSIVCELQACANVIAGPVVVTVGGSEKGESQQTFSYQNPQLSRIVPEKGPLAGGTMLTVHGSQLLTGQRTEQRSDQITGLQAFLGSKPLVWLLRMCVLCLKGKGLTLAMRKEEVVARLGDKECDVKTLDNTHLYCEPPEEQPLALDDSDLPTLKVLMGSLAFDLGPVEYDNDSHSSVPLAAQIGLAAGAAVVVLIVLVIILMRKSKQALRDYKKVLVQLETLEINVGDQCRKEFTDLMTEMMDLSSDVGGPGIPFLDYRTYAERVFFPGQKGAPLSQNLDLPDSRRQTVEQGLGQLNNLLNNRLFLIRFIHTLEAQQSFSQRDRGYVASLLTMALHDKLEYFTDVMKTLLGDLMEQYVAKNPKLMLRRTETVVEKMLTNWMSICLYSFLKEVAGEPLYKLYRAIKYQVDKGPVDVVTGKAKRTLNDSHLLREDIDYCSVVQPCPVKVLDSDTITQVKDKILDQIYKGAPYSQRPAADSLDLEWRSGQAGHLTLSDDDVTAIVQGRWKRINTLQHYKVPDGATVALIPRSQKTPMLEGEEEEGLRLWHLVKPSEDPEIPKHRKSSMRERERAKAIPEIYLTRLLSMKGTLQKFVDDVFVAILSRKRPPPIAVRFFFDFLDDMAEKHGIDDPETVHIWKTNSLPLRFWVNILKNPQFVFDVQVTDSVDAVLSVIAQTFIDSCTTSEHKVGRVSTAINLLTSLAMTSLCFFLSCRYYSDIHNAVSGCYQEMNSTLTELSGSFASEMNSLVALHELYKYINKYYDQIIMSLEEDAAGQKMQLAYRLQQVAALVENKVTDL
uniref:Plexin B3 n=1 Tax=Cyprinus carpio TaxID=7962 RepID=A0A8C2I7U9_CYPCA